MDDREKTRRSEYAEAARRRREDRIGELRRRQELIKQKLKDIADKIKSAKASLVTSS